jgi:hypothetical protein
MTKNGLALQGGASPAFIDTAKELFSRWAQRLDGS